ncbi:MAG: DUF1819 family protein [Desulfosarcina sp.]|nr:DUF1819 family protein [Desulfosarcina sp.]
MTNNDKITAYKGDIVAGSLLIVESRIISELLLDKVSEDGWHQAIVIDNLLQKRSPVAAKRQARLIKNRLSLTGPDLWEMIHIGAADLSTQALLAAAIKHSRLLGDFMETVVKMHWRTFNQKITIRDWKNYLETCAQVDPKINKWTDSTRSKLKQIVFRILAEAKYIDSTSVDFHNKGSTSRGGGFEITPKRG